MARTILTIAQQKEFLKCNYNLTSISHKWSTRGMGNSKILDKSKNVIGNAGGCGYDRYGAALGDAITTMFSAELLKLAKGCKGRRRTYKSHPKFYGLHYNAITGKAWVDGACGSTCMELILNKIGFSLQFVGETDRQANTGQTFYSLIPVTKHHRNYLK